MREPLNLYRKYTVKIALRDKLLGGIPKTEKLIEGWLESREKPELIDETKGQVDLIEDEKKAWTGFKSDDEGIYLEARCVHAMIKESSQVMGLHRQNRGLKQLLQHGVFVKPVKIALAKEPDGFVELVAHVIGPRGPRSTIKRHDYVAAQLGIDFEIWVLDTDEKHAKVFSEADIYKTLVHAQELGLGCSRSQGFGKFDLISFEELEEK